MKYYLRPVFYIVRTSVVIATEKQGKVGLDVYVSTRTHAHAYVRAERHMGTRARTRVPILVKIHLALSNYLTDISFIKLHLHQGPDSSVSLTVRERTTFLMHICIWNARYDRMCL